MWIIDYIKHLLVRFLVNVLKCGPMPKHISFILDGNRRWAKTKNLNLEAGYSNGVSTAEKMIECCIDTGVRETTLYLFSLENTKRSNEEISIIHKMAVKSIIQFCWETKWRNLGLHCRHVGNLEAVPPSIRKISLRGTMSTLHLKNLALNTAFYYTSTDEITAAIKTVVEGVNSGLLKAEDIDEQLISDCLSTSEGIYPDMYIRTSGETRLSDFLSWQSGFTQIFFLKPFWPDLSYRNIFSTILKFQQNQGPLQEVIDTLPTKKHSPKVQKFLKHMQQKRFEKQKIYANEKVDDYYEKLFDIEYDQNGDIIKSQKNVGVKNGGIKNVKNVQ